MPEEQRAVFVVKVCSTYYQAILSLFKSIINTCGLKTRLHLNEGAYFIDMSDKTLGFGWDY